MSWELLPTDYTNAIWSGLKRYIPITNEDETVSFQDVTNYSNKERSFFGAKDANRMNEALNTLMSMVENGTDLYAAFQNYFEVQKTQFNGTADEYLAGFVEYVNSLKAESVQTIEDIKTDYAADIAQFEHDQEIVFNTWFDFIKGQLGADAAGNLQNQINEIPALIYNSTELSSTPVPAVGVKTHYYAIAECPYTPQQSDIPSIPDVPEPQETVADGYLQEENGEVVQASISGYDGISPMAIKFD